MSTRLPDPNELWAQFITTPVERLLTSELRKENALCTEWLTLLSQRARKANNSKKLKIYSALGWVTVAISFPTVFAAPPIGFGIATLGAGVTAGSHSAAKRQRIELSRIDLLTSLYLDRQRHVVAELERRAV